MSGASIILLGSQHNKGINCLGRYVVFIAPSVDYGVNMMCNAIKKTLGYNQVEDILDHEDGEHAYRFQGVRLDAKGKVKRVGDSFYFIIETYNNKHYLSFSILDTNGYTELSNVAIVDYIINEENANEIE